MVRLSLFLLGLLACCCATTSTSALGADTGRRQADDDDDIDLAAPSSDVAAPEAPSLPDVDHARIEIHDGKRGWQPGWQKADYPKQLFSEARTTIDPLNGKNQTDETINDAAEGNVFTVFRKWNRNHTEISCKQCVGCTQKPLPQKYLSGAKLVKKSVACALGQSACNEWSGTYQGPQPEPVKVLVSASDVQQVVKITWPSASPGNELWIDFSHWGSKKSNIKIPTDCTPDTEDWSLSDIRWDELKEDLTWKVPREKVLAHAQVKHH
jgi:hypothetical protein